MGSLFEAARHMAGGGDWYISAYETCTRRFRVHLFGLGRESGAEASQQVVDLLAATIHHLITVTLRFT